MAIFNSYVSLPEGNCYPPIMRISHPYLCTNPRHRTQTGSCPLRCFCEKNDSMTSMSCNLHSGFPPLHRKANKVLQGGMSKVAFYRIIPCLRVTNSKTTHQGPLLLGSAVSGWLCQLGFLCSSGEKPFPVGLVNQLFQPASNQIKTVDKAFT